MRTMEVEKNTAAYAATAATAAYYARMRGSSGQKVAVPAPHHNKLISFV